VKSRQRVGGVRDCVLLILVVVALILGAVHQRMAQRVDISAARATVVAGTHQRTPSNAFQPYLWGLIDDDDSYLTQERGAGIVAKVIRLSWHDFAPGPKTVDAAFVTRMRSRLTQFRQAGFSIILDLGLHDTPSWVHNGNTESFYVDQYGDRYSGAGTIDAGDANLIFDNALRVQAAAYIAQVFATFGTDFYAVRIGGGHYGELTYPTAVYAGHSNCYWAFDSNALASSPVPDWRPGQPSPHGEARHFLNWYLDALVNYQGWQIREVHRRFKGRLMVLYPGWGVRPGQIEAAVAGNLSGATPAERNGEVQAGHDYARQVGAIVSPDVVPTTTWLDADAADDDKPDPHRWSPVKYLSVLAVSHQPRLELYGENTGQGSRHDMDLSITQMRRYGLLGMAWYREAQLFSGRYATLDNYRRAIAANPIRCTNWCFKPRRS